MLLKLLFVMLGGAVGAALRYLVGLLCAHGCTNAFPCGTLIVNCLGCLLLGLLLGLAERYAHFGGTSAYLFLTVGVCGAFTTFSTFSADTFRLMDSGNWLLALAYLAATLVLGFLLLYLGRTLTLR